jgi:hypothetical protein
LQLFNAQILALDVCVQQFIPKHKNIVTTTKFATLKPLCFCFSSIAASNINKSNKGFSNFGNYNYFKSFFTIVKLNGSVKLKNAENLYYILIYYNAYSPKLQTIKALLSKKTNHRSAHI